MTGVKKIGLLAGSSHLMCFGVPLRSEDGNITLTPLHEAGGDFLCLNGPFPREESYWIELERLATDYKLFIFWRGNHHMAQHLFASDPPFDFVRSNQIDLPISKGSVIVPEQMLREKFAHTFDRLETMLKNIAQRTHHGVFVCGTPPPKGNPAVVRALLANEQSLIDRLTALGRSADTVPLTPPETLYKMWSLLQDMARDVAKRHGAQFVPVPVEAQTPVGFLREEFWSSDLTHANDNLGRLFLRRLREYL